MIVPMKHLTLLCVAGESGKALEALRDLGCVHVDLSRGSSNEFVEAKGELERAAEAVRTVQKAKREAPPKAGTAAVRRTVDDVRQLAAEREKAVSEADELRRQIALYEPYGDFDPELARSLIARGIDLSKVCELPDPLPKLRLSETKRLLAEAEAKVVALEAELAATDETWITARNPELKDRVAFEAARDVLETQGAVSWIEGWVPVESVPRLRAKAVTKAWGLLLRDPEGDETPPTLIRPPKLFRPVAALFAGLGIAPGYTESDVSVPFMCYFSLFFAMLVGDGAYGLIFLAATLWGWRKTKPKEGVGHRPRVVRSWLTLLTVFSSATVVWGLLSNTWFGAGFPFAKDWPTVKWLADPSYSNMMLLCFTIGVSHLMLARIWSGIQIINDRTCIAQFGWAGVLLFMYIVTNSIVGIFGGVPQWAFWMFGVSLVMVFGFTLKGSELKSRGIELGMLPLNIMSALGDIISYVRLFAVGLASVKVAENFNSMATGLVAGADSMALKAVMCVAMVAILIVGHGLNLAMAGLSILVHAVRLNTLEFSNHKGVSWAGYAFSPFRKN